MLRIEERSPLGEDYGQQKGSVLGNRKISSFGQIISQLICHSYIIEAFALRVNQRGLNWCWFWGQKYDSI